jgi:hypothetical protein
MVATLAHAVALVAAHVSHLIALIPTEVLPPFD